MTRAAGPEIEEYGDRPDGDDRNEGLGSVAPGVDGEEAEDDRSHSDREYDDRSTAARVCAAALAGEADEHE
ncbi:MAG TPA: hypothetical protein VFR33_16055, partial [Candidatus Dormibacteraeota bacterium]|nr:hypothetical protein [Candidatus Dormibacteraeota bacterium]